MFDLHPYLEEKRGIVEQALDVHLPPKDERPAVLHEAMRYSVFAGGKRFRPILCLASAEAVGGSAERALRPAMAVEVLHTYTLIHDDLPAMDDDALRRGKPTCHKVYGEANAILAGDALLTLAFEWLAECQAPRPYLPNQFALELAEAAGSRGVIAGQVEDLASEGRPPNAELVEYIHLHKTCALIRAAVRIGAIAGGARTDVLNALTIYGGNIGLAFQIVDDILNVTSTAERLGKAAGSDPKRKKVTYAALYGVDVAQAKARELIDRAIAELAEVPGETEPLEAIAQYIIDREK
ncbi:MAG: farnesyl diphosphate synthase [Verrucomicrobiota bacterium]